MVGHGAAERRRGKSGEPGGEQPPGLSPGDPAVLEGDRAEARIARDARQSIPRRTLQTLPGFEEASPEVGELDVTAVTAAHEEDPDATLELLATLARATDPRLRAAARRLAAQLFWRDAAHGHPRRRGAHRIASIRSSESGDLDLERSLDAVVHARATGSAIDTEELWTRHWRHSETAWCLVVDRSGSMHGAALATAAMTAGAFALRAGSQRAVLAFADDVVALASMGDQHRDDELLDRVLDLRGDGTTELARALRAAADQLGRSAARRRVTVLLSDCRATHPDQVAAAARLHEELLVLAPADDPQAALELGRVTGARVAAITGPSQVPAALDRLLG